MTAREKLFEALKSDNISDFESFAPLALDVANEFSAAIGNTIYPLKKGEMFLAVHALKTHLAALEKELNPIDRTMLMLFEAATTQNEIRSVYPSKVTGKEKGDG